MRILLASDFYPPFIGGAERQTQLLGRKLQQNGHSVHIGTVWHDGQSEITDEDGLMVHRWKGLTTSVPWFSRNQQRRYHPPFPDPRIVFNIRKLLKQFEPDIVHASGWIAYSCAAALLGKDTPFLLSVRDYGYSCALRTMLHDNKVCQGPELYKCVTCASKSYGLPKAFASVLAVFGGKQLLRHKATGVHSISTFVQEVVQRDLLKRTPDASNVSVIIPSFLDKDSHQETQISSINLPSNGFILFVGALQAIKGIQELISAYEKLVDPPPLVLMGSIWADSPAIPSNITVLQNVPHAEVMKAWQHCLFGVAPSIWPEPLGMVVAEAMSAGKAIVGTRVGGIPDMIIDGETGLLVPPGDVEALADAMQKLIDSPDLCNRLGVAGQARSRLFLSDTVVPRYEALYSKLIDSKN